MGYCYKISTTRRQAMNKINRFIIWICSRFTRDEIEQIIQGLTEVLANRNPEVKPKDDFKEKHPNYRNFFVDPNPPLPADSKPSRKLNWKDLLNEYKKTHGKPLKTVNPRKTTTKVPKNSICRICGAPSKYLYFNDGKKRSQIKCKVCHSLSQVHPRNRRKAKYLCPHCGRPLFLWKERKEVSIYKCDYDRCPLYLANKAKLNLAEKILSLVKSSQFKLRYNFREYHFTNEELNHSSPKKKILNINKSLNTICLALTFHISMGLSSRKTAFILRNVFSLPVSYRTILNYTQHAAYYCHAFNLTHKGNVDDRQAGDETYIKISGENGYTFFFISEKSRKITAYHIADNRGTLPATISMKEAIRTAKPNQKTTFVTDGNPSYPASIHFLNQMYDSTLTHKKVIGLQNLDEESEDYRPLKQLVERLNRTYKYHTRAACGFNSPNGAIALTTLFVTHYNFLRPHSSLDYNVPVPLPELENIPTIQGRWAKVLKTGIAIAS
jgi:putative transposase